VILKGVKEMAATIEICQIIISSLVPIVYILVTWYLTTRPQRSDISRNVKKELLEILSDITDNILSFASKKTFEEISSVLLVHKIHIKTSQILSLINISLDLSKEDKNKLLKFKDLTDDWKETVLEMEAAFTGRKKYTEEEADKHVNIAMELLEYFSDIVYIIQKSRLKENKFF